MTQLILDVPINIDTAQSLVAWRCLPGPQTGCPVYVTGGVPVRVTRLQMAPYVS